MRCEKGYFPGDAGASIVNDIQRHAHMRLIKYIVQLPRVFALNAKDILAQFCELLCHQGPAVAGASPEVSTKMIATSYCLRFPRHAAVAGRTDLRLFKAVHVIAQSR